MISTPALIPILAEATGIGASTVSNVSRRLSEHGVLPRGSRGKAAPSLDPNHVAQLLVALLLLSDGYAANRDIASLPERLRELDRHRQNKELRSSEHQNGNVVLITAGSFVEQVAHLLRLCSTEEISSLVSRNIAALGLTFSETGCVGWAQFWKTAKLKSGGGVTIFRVDKLSNAKRVVFGAMSIVDERISAGLIREARIRLDVIVRLAQAMADG